MVFLGLVIVKGCLLLKLKKGPCQKILGFFQTVGDISTEY